ncbi:MAG: hypothetical protein K2N63_05010 [Lachnospiraceae bacterium]|nr:hypothetical protein [Lachnospiraceae bacterium]
MENRMGEPVHRDAFLVGWGVCVDIGYYGEGLYQGVVQYGMMDDGRAVIMQPESGGKIQVAEKDLLPLSAPPKFVYGEQVLVISHPGMVGTVLKIHWHFKEERCFYTLLVDGKIRSKRYFDNDLKKIKKNG